MSPNNLSETPVSSLRHRAARTVAMVSPAVAIVLPACSDAPAPSDEELPERFAELEHEESNVPEPAPDPRKTGSVAPNREVTFDEAGLVIAVDREVTYNEAALTVLPPGSGQMGVGFGVGTRGAGGGGVMMGCSRSTQARRPVVLRPRRAGAVNGVVDPRQDPVSTFAADVDTGSYTLTRRILGEQNALPPRELVRVEEFVNYLEYDYPRPTSEVRPFAVDFEAAPSPYEASHTLLKIGIQGRTVPEASRKPAHLTFLVDVSGSMAGPEKLGLAQRALHLLVDRLDSRDTVALATYSGGVREVLAPTGTRNAKRIHAAIDRLSASGSTNMSGGLELAYKLAYRTLKPGHINRIIVLSDGDANVGGRDHREIYKRIEHYTKEGVTLSTIGFGMGNYRDANMEQLADKGNGNYAYVDSLSEARRIFVENLTGTLQVIAKDVKIQVEFDPAVVAGYRLVGYENRDIADSDFRKDHVDAGEIGSGHQVTAIYALDLRHGADATALATVRIRHKLPEGASAREDTFEFTARHAHPSFDDASEDFKVAVAAMGFAEKLRGSPWAVEWSWKTIRRIAMHAAGDSKDRRELASLITKAARLDTPTLAAN